MEPLKQVQVEGYLMFAEPQDLFGNLDEVCSVSFLFNSINCLISVQVIPHLQGDVEMTGDIRAYDRSIDKENRRRMHVHA